MNLPQEILLKQEEISIEKILVEKNISCVLSVGLGVYHKTRM